MLGIQKLGVKRTYCFCMFCSTCPFPGLTMACASSEYFTLPWRLPPHGRWCNYNISTAQGGGGSFQRLGTYRKRVCGVQLVRKWIDVRFKRVESQMILVVNWFEIQLIWLSIDLCFKWFWLSVDLRFNWFGCQLIWDSNDFGCPLIWDSTDLVVNWFVLQMISVVNWSEIQVIRLSIDLRFKWFGCQSVWNSNELVVNWFEIQVIWMSNDLMFKWFGCQLMCDSNDFVKRSFCARLPSKLELWNSKTKHFCETSFKNEALKLKNEAFLRDFLQKWSFETQKRSISARLPSKMKLWRSKTKHFCETSFKNEALKLKNEAFLRDFLQKWSFEAQERSFSARLPSKMTCRPDTWPQNYNTF